MLVRKKFKMDVFSRTVYNSPILDNTCSIIKLTVCWGADENCPLGRWARIAFTLNI